MQEYKRRQFRGHPLSLAGKSLRTEGFRGVLASRAQLGLGDQLRFETTFPRSLSRRRFETLVCRLFRDRVDGTHAEAPVPRRRRRGQAVREVLAPILTFVSFMTSR
jgi:hypothetical protein